jgi:glycosyltransferase involved in cell wall biosynthesis
VKVLHVITGLAAGGAEQQLRLLLRHQSGRAEVATLTNPGMVAGALRDDGVVVHEIQMQGNRDLSALPRLVTLMNTGRYDVVHTHLYRACVYGRVAARLAGVGRVVATEHSLGDHLIEGRRLTRATRALYLSTERLGHMTIAVSSTVARRLEGFGVPAGRITVIPNGIRAADFAFDPGRRARVRAWLGIQPEEFVVGFVGRLVPGKRVDLVLKTLRGLEARALIVGAGPEESTLRALAANLGVAATFTGESSDIAGPLGAMDLLVAPSTEETFGLAVVEAVASGLPVFYSACPALDDLPTPIPAARAVPADLESLRPAVTAAVLNGARRLPVPPVLEQYDIARIAQRVDDLYARLGHRASTLKTGARDE